MDPKLELSGALLDLSSASSRLLNICLGQPPGDQSRAAQDLLNAVDGPDWTTSSVRRAHEAVLSADLAGIDHVRALAVLLRSSIETAISLATVVRGTAEALSRIHWILTADGAAQMVLRHVSLTLDDIYFPEKLEPNVPFGLGLGGSLTVADYRDLLTARLTSYGFTTALRVRPTELASAVLDHSLPNGRTKYSQLSAAAHGQSMTVSAFIDLNSPTTNDNGELSMKLPVDFAVEYAGYTVLLMARQHDAIAEYFGAPHGELKRWIQRRDRALSRFTTVDRATRGASGSPSNGS